MTNAAQLAPVDKLQLVLSNQQIRSQFDNCLKDKAPAFIASLIDLYGGDNYLQQCDPKAVAMEALKAATLDLPINKQLGFAYIVPYRTKGVLVPQFQIGYKGYIQLAQRSGLYKAINAAVIPEGLKVLEDWITGEITISGTPKSNKSQGYLGHFRLLNGFEKTLYMDREDMEIHAQKYSKSYASANSPWKTHFDEMARKTVLRLLLSKYGPLSTEMQMAFTSESDEDPDKAWEEEVEENANRETIDAEFTVQEGPEKAEGKKDKASAKPEPPKDAEKPKRRKPSYR